MLIKKISQIKKFSTHIKKICLHINKICSHIQKRIRLYIQKTHGKSPRQILAVISHDKFVRQIATANSQICNTEDGVEQSSVLESFMREDKNKTNNKAKDIRINLIN